MRNLLRVIKGVLDWSKGGSILSVVARSSHATYNYLLMDPSLAMSGRSSVYPYLPPYCGDDVFCTIPVGFLLNTLNFLDAGTS